MTRWLGIDVGGANLKLANMDGYAQSQPFELWNRRDQLPNALREAIALAPPGDSIAATMTGELADCYRSKAEGVRHIAASLATAAEGRNLQIYTVEGTFASVQQACDEPALAAASNWHALARYASRWLPQGTGLVIDIGSTTADLVPVRNGKVATRSRTDTERLVAGELVYTGVGRTPVCAVVDALPYSGEVCPVAAELFATTADVYRVLGLADAEGGAADGRTFDLTDCIDRLARQVCADSETFDEDDAIAASNEVYRRQLAQLRYALTKVSHACGDGSTSAVVVSGSGEWLAAEVAAGHDAEQCVCRMSEQIGVAQSQCAAAVAVAHLAAEEDARDVD